MTSERRVLVHADATSLAGSVAARFITKVIDLLDEKPVVHLVLTGGRVGTAILASINDSEARDSIDWSRVHVWWGDERWLPDGDGERNDTQARDALLNQIDLAPERIHAFATSYSGIGLDEAAEAYALELRAAAEGGADAPVFDITFLGVGPDGHIASLFPDMEGVRERERTVIPVRNAPKPPPERLSLTMPTLNGSDRIWMSLSGSDKASALGLALAGANPIQVPAAGARGTKRTVFFVDGDAAAEVPPRLISPEY